MTQLVSESRIFGTLPQGNILEISFRGTHECSHGGEMNRYIREKLEEHAPAAIVFNLLDYQYVWGNDVGVLFWASIVHRNPKEIRPVCILATGTTYTSLYNLSKDSKLIDVFKIEFASTEELALERLRERLGNRSV